MLSVVNLGDHEILTLLMEVDRHFLYGICLLFNGLKVFKMLAADVLILPEVFTEGGFSRVGSMFSSSSMLVTVFRCDLVGQGLQRRD